LSLPPWSILFSKIGAVVADTGGVLSHSATVAREYGIPCVVGTIVGTTTIPDGALLAGNGAEGEILILEVPDE
jgi:pyruvate,water dikinase